MTPVFEHPDRKNIEAEAAKFGIVAKVVKGKEKSEPETSEAKVETKG